MELSLKPDFDRAVERLEAWWHCEVLDRACVQMHVARPGEHRPYPAKKHATLRERWMDVEYHVESCLRSYERTYYVGEAFPTYFANLGPDICATLLGGELEFMPGTSWAEPFVDDWNDVDFTPQFERVYWDTIRKMTDLALEVGEGKFITGLTDLHMNGDLLSAVRGREQLCLDLHDRPDELREVIRKAGAMYPVVFDDLWNRIKAKGLGCTTWLSVYHHDRYYATSMDFAGLISPEMFQDFFLPIIVDEIEFLERSLFHLDGPTALPHLDTLLSIPKLNGIQWVFGAGNGPCTRWIEVYRRIQNAGKCAQVIVENVEEIFTILDELPPNGLLFTGGGWGMTPDEAEALLKRIEKAGAKHAHTRIKARV
jgi:hypothetical protein